MEEGVLRTGNSLEKHERSSLGRENSVRSTSYTFEYRGNVSNISPHDVSLGNIGELPKTRRDILVFFSAVLF